MKMSKLSKFSKSFYAVFYSALAMLVMFFYTETLLAKGPGNNNKQVCFEAQNVQENGKKQVIRDQFNAGNLVILIDKLVQDYLGGQDTCIVLPVWSWTGNDPFPTRSNLPVDKVQISSMTDDELAEHVISLVGLLMMEVDPSARTGLYSNDIGNIEPFKPGQDVYLTQAVEAMQLLVDKNANQEIALSETRSIALLLGITHMKSLARFYGDENYHYSNNFLQNYSSVMHKHYNQLQESYLAFIGVLSSGNAWLNFAAAPASLIPLLDLNDVNARMFVEALKFDKRQLEKMVQAEQEGVDNYYWPKIFVDTLNSTILTEEYDVERNKRDPALSLEIYNFPGQIMIYDWLEQSVADFTALDVAAPLGIPGVFSYNGFPPFDIIGIAPFIQTIAPKIADEVLLEAGEIWDNELKPLYQQLLTLSEIRRAQAHDDAYTGSWRAKIPEVVRVMRNKDGTAKSVIVKTNDASGNLNVPIGGPLSDKPAIRKVQEGIAEMDKWFNDNLANAQTLHDGDKLNLLYKVDESRGACGDITGTDRYGDIDEVIANYSTRELVVGANGDGELADLVYQSGFAIARFLYDLREVTADLYIKEKWQEYNFADQASAGVCRVNAQGEEITYERVRDEISAAVPNGFETSDVNRLGRHYGYDAAGNQIPAEWSNGELNYAFSAPDINGDLKTFDYVYRQHYAVDPNMPLKFDAANPMDPAQSNIFDPQTGKMFYQYTDAGDSTRRGQFLDEFSALEVLSDGGAKAGQKGTYYRWKLDFMFQKISAFVIAKAPTPEVNLLPGDFVQEYYGSTFVDTNGDTCGFNLVKDKPEILRFRIIGQLGGSANSGTSVDPGDKTVDINVRLVTLAPHRDRQPIYQLSLMLHEGSLGHGFDNVPNNMDFLRGIDSQLSWLTNVNSNGIVGEGGVASYPVTGPGVGTLFEGWATYGEVLGAFKGLIVNFDDNGCPVDGDVNLAAQFFGLVELSRLGGRQVVSVGMNYSKYAWTFYKSVNEFTRLTDIPVEAGTDFHMRFIGHPTQQTTYAAGLITNLGVLAKIRDAAQAEGCAIKEEEFNKFRITRTDYILGAPLNQIVEDNLDIFLDCGS